MKTYLTTKNIQQKISELALKPAAKIGSVIRAIAERAREDGARTCSIYIHKDLISSSYWSVPAMFGRTYAGWAEDYEFHTATRDRNFICLRLSNQPRSATFKGRVMQRLMSKGKATTKMPFVPTTYRRNPRALALILTKDCDTEVLFRADEEKIVWYFAGFAK